MGGGTIGNDYKRRTPGASFMTQRQRKALGTVLTLVALLAWTAIGMWVYDAFLVGAHNIVLLAFFVGFGLAWIFPAMAIIRWMARPD